MVLQILSKNSKRKALIVQLRRFRGSIDLHFTEVENKCSILGVFLRMELDFNGHRGGVDEPSFFFFFRSNMGMC